MAIAKAAAIYTRISQDDAGLGLGVQRQESACRELAAKRGWEVAEVYQDNDLSAYKGSRRPEYERMLADLTSGDRDAVIVYHVDRLTRRPMELERFMDLCDEARIANIATVTGDLDLSNHDGRFMARLLGSIASKESAQKSDRVKAAARQRAEAGRVAGGGLRPFGFEPDRRTIRESEAEIIRQLVPRYIAGESLSSLATWLQEEDIPTVTGGQWRTPTVRALLQNPRYAGYRTYHGEVIAKAEWPAIITEEQHRQALAAFERRKATGRRTPRRYLLSGLLRCGKCQAKLFSQPQIDANHTRRRYSCRKGPDHDGCGSTHITAELIEEWMTEAVLYRLDSPAMADALAGRAAEDERLSRVTDELATAKAQLIELSDLWRARRISTAEWMAQRDPIESAIKNLERQVSMLTGTTVLDGYVGNASALRSAWEGLNLSRQAAIIAAVLDYAEVGPGKPGARQLDPARITPIWRL